MVRTKVLSRVLHYDKPILKNKPNYKIFINLSWNVIYSLLLGLVEPQFVPLLFRQAQKMSRHCILIFLLFFFSITELTGAWCRPMNSDYILKDYRTHTNPPYSMLIDGVGCNPQLG